eukprot:8953701-Pyramimonas_sp.AAC.1
MFDYTSFVLQHPPVGGRARPNAVPTRPCRGDPRRVALIRGSAGACSGRIRRRRDTKAQGMVDFNDTRA